MLVNYRIKGLGPMQIEFPELTDDDWEREEVQKQIRRAIGRRHPMKYLIGYALARKTDTQPRPDASTQTEQGDPEQ